MSSPLENFNNIKGLLEQRVPQSQQIIPVGIFIDQITTSYLADLPAPKGLNTCNETSSWRSREAVAREVPVIPTYLRTFIPPWKVSGPSASMRLMTLFWRGFSLCSKTEK